MSELQRVNFMATDRFVRALKEAAQKAEKSQSQFIRDAVEATVKAGSEE